ncbi:5-bromo-4-chloroindolyl phosphate hydrolysis protein [Cytobacillus horneckiae]|nr:5-bromo-4-chloroindolyl phosphate hydrolysis family protein [Cytobacillus horneckiae]MEC1158358.1 5-bromo-4-chloroindolyl phosphate hydrolysis family protein [Cytobacillus horneckiae]MED2937369.1 5-bromo-4-chloroindolyl phosphate hydrolysis family protein [Cytobacillus horneckiae]
MNPFFMFFIRTLIAVPLSVTVWLLNYFAFDMNFWMSGLNGTLAGVLAYWITGAVMRHRFIKSHGLKRKEYLYIKKNLDEAKGKLNRLQRSLMSIRHLPSTRQRRDFIKVAKRIYKLTKKEPRRFYQAEQFYYSHLDSAVELAEKYVFLSSQPRKTKELEISLNETRKTLHELTVNVEKDLHDVLANDIDQLHFEMDVAKHSIKKIKDSRINDESRRLK